MRALDDKIIYTINTSMPTDSFKKQFDGTATCKTLYDSVSYFVLANNHNWVTAQGILDIITISPSGCFGKDLFCTLEDHTWKKKNTEKIPFSCARLKLLLLGNILTWTLQIRLCELASQLNWIPVFKTVADQLSQPREERQTLYRRPRRRSSQTEEGKGDSAWWSQRAQTLAERTNVTATLDNRTGRRGSD